MHNVVVECIFDIFVLVRELVQSLVVCFVVSEENFWKVTSRPNISLKPVVTCKTNRLTSGVQGKV